MIRGGTRHELRFATRRRLWSALGGFDTGIGSSAWAIADLEQRVRALGYVVNAPASPPRSTPPPQFERRWSQARLPDPAVASVRQGAVVYTAITAGRDALREQPASAVGGVPFVAFVDARSRPWSTRRDRTATWQLRDIAPSQGDPNRAAKIYKVLSHRYFPDAEYSLWIDGSVSIAYTFETARLFALYLQRTDLCMFRHTQRRCLYAEAEVCRARQLDAPAVIDAQVERYRRDGYPADAGLGEATVLLRRHSPAVRAFNEMWWDEISNGSKRDQISLGYVAWKLGLDIGYFPIDLFGPNGLFRKVR
jgi:hypothetical protein